MLLTDIELSETRAKLEAMIDAAVDGHEGFAWVSADSKQRVEAEFVEKDNRWIVKVSCGVRPNHQIIPVKHFAVRDLFIAEALHCVEMRVLAHGAA